MTASGLIIAAPASGQGKTLVTLGLLRHLQSRGLRVAAGKVGPDYIDPRFHAHAGGGGCATLDGWAMRPTLLSAQINALARDSDLILIEGVMGLFDGIGPGFRADPRAPQQDGSTAGLAAALGWPVLLVVDGRGQGESVAALLHGFCTYRPPGRSGAPQEAPTIAGVLFNRVGSLRHLDRLRAAAAPSGLAILGGLPKDPRATVPSRHLGLVQADELQEREAHITAAADLIARHVDVAALLDLAQPATGPLLAPRSPASTTPAMPSTIPPLGQRIAVARDEAFSFAYPHVLESWQRAGAQLLFFSPLAGEGPEETADAVYLPGGYPELWAGQLAGCAAFLDGLRRRAAAGAVLYGECGGYMVLGEGLVDGAGQRHAMAGLLPVATSFAERRLTLGYRRVGLRSATPLGPAGALFRGHEFHYATLVTDPGTDIRTRGDALFDAEDARNASLGALGHRRGAVFGSFVHLIDHN